MDRCLHAISYLLLLLVVNACTVYQVPPKTNYASDSIPVVSPFKDISLLVHVDNSAVPTNRRCRYLTKDIVSLLIESKLFRKVIINDSHASYDLVVTSVANEETMDCRSPEASMEAALMVITLGIIPIKETMNYKHLLKFVSKNGGEESKPIEFINVRRSYGGSLVNLLRYSDGWSSEEPDYSINVENFKRLLLANKDPILKLVADGKKNTGTD